MNDEIQERLNELEVRFSHQSLQVDELNDVVTACNLQIEQLTRELKQVRGMLKSLQPSLEESPDE